MSIDSSILPDTAPPVRRWGTARDAAVHAGVAERTIRQWDNDGVITGYRIGPRLVRYDLNEIDALLVAGAHGPQPVTQPATRVTQRRAARVAPRTEPVERRTEPDTQTPPQSIDECVDAIVAGWPALSDAQIARIAALLTIRRAK